MPPDLDALLTALYVLADDFLPKRCGPGRRPRISDAEIVCLAVAQIFLDCAKEAGLQADPRYQAKFPPSELATLSINFFTPTG